VIPPPQNDILSLNTITTTCLALPTSSRGAPSAHSTMPTHLSFLQTAALIAALPSVIDASVGFDCSNIVSQKARWNLSPLAGPRAVHWIRPGSPSTSNFTFTLDICKPLKRHKGVPAADECVGSTRSEYTHGKQTAMSFRDQAADYSP
jgi:hypothetical protein